VTCAARHSRHAASNAINLANVSSSALRRQFPEVLMNERVARIKRSTTRLLRPVIHIIIATQSKPREIFYGNQQKIC
jgi:hypothetical protein